MDHTQRRSFLKRATAWAFGLGSLTTIHACTSEQKETANIIRGDFIHMVFFWLKEPDNKATRENFEKELKAFIDNTPGITRKHIGMPAHTNREVIDNTYTYSLVLSFISKKEHDQYQEHPLHKKFIENAGALWEKVLVYDSELMPQL